MPADFEFEQDFQYARERLELALNATGVGLWDWDLHTGHTYCSSHFCEMLGYERGALSAIPEGWRSLIHADDALRVGKAFDAYVDGTSSQYEIEYRIRQNTGAYLPVLSRARTSRRDSSGRALRVVGIEIDRTEFVRLDQELRQAHKMAAVGLLAGGVAHDFNNLLTVINGYSQLLLSSTRLGDRSADYLQMIQAAGKRAVSLIRSLLAFGRYQPGELGPVFLNDVIAEVSVWLGRLLPENIQLTTGLDPRLRPVLADAGSIQTALMNLVVNARDAMPRGGEIRITTTNVALPSGLVDRHMNLPPGDYVLFTVNDTGEGIDEADQAHLFEPFHTTKAPGAGTGLGLTTVRRIVTESTGGISIYSEKHRGTVVKIYLPAAQPTPLHSAAASPAEIRGGTETVLLVEDNSEVRNLCANALESLGYTILTAADAAQAAEKASRASAQLDLLICDCVLPDGLGTDVAAHLSQLRPDLPILFISGYAEGLSLPQPLPSRRVEFLQKPFVPDMLAARVREILDRRNRRLILMIDEDSALLERAASTLTNDGFEILTTTRTAEIASLLFAYKVDLLIVALGMPGFDDIGRLNELRAQYPNLPIVAIAGLSKAHLLQPAMQAGVRSVLRKPFSPADLLETVRRSL